MILLIAIEASGKIRMQQSTSQPLEASDLPWVAAVIVQQPHALFDRYHGQMDDGILQLWRDPCA